MAPKQRKSERKTQARQTLLKRIKETEDQKPDISIRARRSSVNTTRSWCMNLVAQLHLLGTYNSEDIAAYLKERHGIDLRPVTIRKYIGEMRTKWQEMAMQDTNTMITGELSKLQQLEEFAIGALRSGGLRVTDDGAFVQLSNPEGFCGIMLKISKRRSALMGLDKAQKIIVKDERTSELTDEELETILKSARKAKGAA